MRKKYMFVKKIYISIFSVIIIMIATISTTFAWVGMLSNSTFDKFDVLVKGSNLEEYGVLISTTGEEGTFSDSLNPIDIKRQILKNWGYKDFQLDTDVSVNNIFSSLNMEQCTMIPVINDDSILKFGTFKRVEGYETTNLFKFDFYITPTRFYEKDSNTDYELEVNLNSNLIQGTESTYELKSEISYNSSFKNPLVNLQDSFTKLEKIENVSSVKINSQSAYRVGFEKYSVVELGKTEEYIDISPKSGLVLHQDYDYPVINNNSKVISFGGIMEDDNNFAVLNYNKNEWNLASNGVRNVSISNAVLSSRGVNSKTKDISIYDYSELFVDPNKDFEKIKIGQMMKITCYFWVEGADPDCFNIIDSCKTSLDIVLSTVKE